MNNVKEAIRKRCVLCEGPSCDSEKCELYNMTKRCSQETRNEAIRTYCTWCMNGKHIKECDAPSCYIYQFRQHTTGDLHVDFLPFIPRRRIL